MFYHLHCYSFTIIAKPSNFLRDMMLRPKSSSSSSSSVHNQHFNPSLTRCPLPFTGNRFGVPPLPPPPFNMYHSTSRMVAGGGGGGENLPPPPGRFHRRSVSDDVPYGFSSMMMPQSLKPPLFPFNSLERSVSDKSHLVKEESVFKGRMTPESESMDDLLSAYLNLDAEEMAESSRGTTRKSNGGGYSSDSEGESNLKRRAFGDIDTPTSRHYRSVSMDSSFLGKLPPSSARVSPTNSGEGAYRVVFGNCEFGAEEMKRISADEKLGLLVVVDPKRVKRILSNRLSAARSKERQAKYTAKLEHMVRTLQSEATTLSARLTHLHRGSMGLQNQNSELRFRIQTMEQQAQVRHALSEQLSEEVQRLRVMVTGEPSRSESDISKTSPNPEMFQQQLRISQLQHQHSNQNRTMRANHAPNG